MAAAAGGAGGATHSLTGSGPTGIEAGGGAGAGAAGGGAGGPLAARGPATGVASRRSVALNDGWRDRPDGFRGAGPGLLNGWSHGGHLAQAPAADCGAVVAGRQVPG